MLSRLLKKGDEPSPSLGKRSILEESSRLREVSLVDWNVKRSSLLMAFGWMRKSGMKSGGSGGRKKFSMMAEGDEVGE